ncbi:MAG: dethiobiotin synthase [Spirochaetes bacterium GWF1_41_5]|nr:MAG: dethiobiotin synthase [Spirochaetes bacterium GWF1_41_5]
MGIIFITGTGTGVGKTYFTGLLARACQEAGINVITQKPVQTGCRKQIADDILLHRKLQGIKCTIYDKKKITCPYIFSYPASPHLAAARAKTSIQIGTIIKQSAILEKNFSLVLIEGAGGLLVPLTENFTILDYIARCGFPVVLVTQTLLGSINQTLLSIEALQQKKIKIMALAVNLYFKEKPAITGDFPGIIRAFHPEIPIIFFKNKISGINVRQSGILSNLNLSGNSIVIKDEKKI